MKLVHEFLGFIVLTGPLWLIVLAVLVSIGLSRWVSKHYPQQGKRIAIKAGIFLFAFLILFGDEIAGGIYLNYLCATKAGVKVYQTVELPAEYWDEQGKPKFYDEKNGNFYLSKDYPTEFKIDSNYSFLYIDKLVTHLRDQKKDKLFSERVSYMLWGGWIRRNLSPHNTATSCSNNLEQYGNFIKQTFKQANSR